MAATCPGAVQVGSGRPKMPLDPKLAHFGILSINSPSWASFEGLLDPILGPFLTESFYIESSSLLGVLNDF